MRAIKAAAESETNRMFESDLFEFFSRTPWWLPLVIFVPIISFTGYRAIELGTSPLMFPPMFLVGVVVWTLLEYWLHRVLFHYDAKSKLGQRFIWLSHGVHHDWPNDKMRLVFPPAISIPLALLFFWLFGLAFGDAGRYAPFAGLAFGYLAYDMIHYATHHFAWDGKVMKYLRAYHMAHHFKHEPTRYGVSNPLWDYVFGTAPKKS